MSALKYLKAYIAAHGHTAEEGCTLDARNKVKKYGSIIDSDGDTEKDAALEVCPEEGCIPDARNLGGDEADDSKNDSDGAEKSGDTEKGASLETCTEDGCTPDAGNLGPDETQDILNDSDYMNKYGDTEKGAAIVAAAIMWQHLERHYIGCGKVSTLQEIIEDIGEGHMGLIGPGNGCVTKCFEKVVGRNKLFRLHSLPHDVSGRFREVHKVGPGYLYTIPVKKNEGWFMRQFRGFSLSGHIFGMINAFRHRNDVESGEWFDLLSIQT